MALLQQEGLGGDATRGWLLCPPALPVLGSGLDPSHPSRHRQRRARQLLGRLLTADFTALAAGLSLPSASASIKINVQN